MTALRGVSEAGVARNRPEPSSQLSVFNFGT
jgi:hypothetical protein